MAKTSIGWSFPSLAPRQYKDGEQYFPIDWKKLKPESCALDYNSQEDHEGIYAEIYDTNTATLIARTSSYREEQYAFNAAERIITHLCDEFGFGYDLEQVEKGHDIERTVFDAKE